MPKKSGHGDPVCRWSKHRICPLHFDFLGGGIHYKQIELKKHKKWIKKGEGKIEFHSL
ncbi:hypothetical protein PNH38_11180 [Anoxybacillus rupiensis]|uniref:Uncharacterized protein n=1 Tax=Anoxybacteroides rupiense TaxID=311460 RepID=A0ABT5W547_9BACL|nr:hypothetical protein [Anoxybacillus rupiensis]